MENDYRAKSIISKLGADSKLVGILNIVLGVINCLTISGIISGVIMIITGMKAKEAGDHFQNFSAFSDEAEEYRGLESLGKYFRWMKISIIVSLVVVVVLIIISLMTGSMMKPRSNPYDYSL
jgi:ABC-type glycerol-3-phosphate transport system permease component